MRRRFFTLDVFTALRFAGDPLAVVLDPDGLDDEVVIEQGYEMGRPSLIRVAFGLRQGRLQSGSIGGDAVMVTEGAVEA